VSDQQKFPDLPNRLEAERVYLRPYQTGDGPLLYRVSLRNRDHLALYERSSFFLAVFKKTTDKFLGQICLGPTRQDPLELEVGFMADVDQQGRGYITEALWAALDFAFRDLEARRVFMECADSNHRSWAVAERCGMVRKAHLQENKLQPNGSQGGTYHYSLDQAEWPARMKKKPDSWTL
jgi:RimJ/RimL family protein N-acetyltransferase